MGGQLAEYLAGYVAGYWAGYEFAIDEPHLPHADGGDEGDVEGPPDPASGGASAPTTAPAPEPPQGASRLPSAGATGGGSAASAVSSLPAIHQPAASAGGEGEGEGATIRIRLAGELERIHAHRGIVLGLRIAAAEMFRIDLPEAEQAIAALLSKDWGNSEVLR